MQTFGTSCNVLHPHLPHCSEISVRGGCTVVRGWGSDRHYGHVLIHHGYSAIPMQACIFPPRIAWCCGPNVVVCGHSVGVTSLTVCHRFYVRIYHGQQQIQHGLASTGIPLEEDSERALVSSKKPGKISTLMAWKLVRIQYNSVIFSLWKFYKVTLS